MLVPVVCEIVGGRLGDNIMGVYAYVRVCVSSILRHIVW